MQLINQFDFNSQENEPRRNGSLQRPNEMKGENFFNLIESDEWLS